MTEKDILLEGLVTIVNTTVNLSIGMTLNIGGQIITGDLISYREYLDQLGKPFGQANDEYGLGETLQGLFENLAGDLAEISQGDVTIVEPDFIHMKSVVMHPEKLCLPLWRGKLTSVDGFVLERSEVN